MSASMSKLRASGGSRLGAHLAHERPIQPRVPLQKTLPSLPGFPTSTARHSVPTGPMRLRVCAADLGDLSQIASSGAHDLPWSLVGYVSPESSAQIITALALLVMVLWIELAVVFGNLWRLRAKVEKLLDVLDESDEQSDRLAMAAARREARSELSSIHQHNPELN